MGRQQGQNAVARRNSDSMHDDRSVGVRGALQSRPWAVEVEGRQSSSWTLMSMEYGQSWVGERTAEMWLECGKEVRPCRAGRAAGTRAGRRGFHCVEGRVQGGARRRGAESVSASRLLRSCWN